MRSQLGRLARWASLTVLCLAGLGLPVQAGAAERQPDGGGFGIQLLDAPVNRRSDPRAHRSIVDHLPPGTVIDRRMLVVNKSPKRLRVEIYPGAATLDKGEFHYGAGRAANELTSWISVDRSQVDLEPGGEAKVKVTITVPPNASAGERYAVIWASVHSSPNPTANVDKINRVGIRAYLDIGPGGEPRSDFSIGKVLPARDKQGQPSVAVDVHNTGGRALDMTGSVSLSDGPAGMRAGPFEVARGTTLAPGEPGSVSVAFPKELPNGPWKIEVNLESGMVKHTATGKISFPDPGQVGKPSIVFARLGVPWTTAGASMGVGLVIIVGLALVARHSRKKTATLSE
ncbi:hypothetical protein [Micromonospora sp. U21]|uniref:hypothetical protein n=1 Tax=Micromonospora sp. U21 TaxID=2824899 RepID=UPI001B379E34|nr:hypothetical protein [Micromonospora sp. U21]MBQ0904991.1 hypothetical protein [Micromonospora sp. U21]